MWTWKQKLGLLEKRHKRKDALKRGLQKAAPFLVGKINNNGFAFGYDHFD